MTILTDAVDIRGTKPRSEINLYIQATGNFFRLTELEIGLSALYHLVAETRQISKLLKTFNIEWSLSQHLAEIAGELVVAVVRTSEDLLFNGECFPHEDFRAHVLKASRYLDSEAKRRENLRKTGKANTRDHVEALGAKRDVIGGGADSTSEKLLLSLTRSDASKLKIKGGDGADVEVGLPSRGQVADNKKPLSGSKTVHVKIAAISLRYVADLVDGSLALLTDDLDPALVAEGEYVTHDRDLIPTRKLVRDADGITVITSNQLGLDFDAGRAHPDEQELRTA